MAKFRTCAWVLMDNHYHWGLETPEANLVAGMTWFQNTFTRRINCRNRLRGHLFGGRYEAILIEGALSAVGYTPAPLRVGDESRSVVAATFAGKVELAPPRCVAHATMEGQAPPRVRRARRASPGKGGPGTFANQCAVPTPCHVERGGDDGGASSRLPACKPGGHRRGNEPVTQTFPEHRFVDVSPDVAVELGWSEAMDSATVTQEEVNLVNQWSGKEVDVTISYQQTEEDLTIQPAAALETSSGYSLTLGSGIASQSGAEFSQAAEWELRFRTRASSSGGGGGGGDPGYGDPGPGGPSDPGSGPDPSPPAGGNPPDGSGSPDDEETYEVEVEWGDPSGSSSEVWSITIEGQGPDDESEFTDSTPGPGETDSAPVTLQRGNAYKVTMEHVSTNLETDSGPDFDWEATLDGKPDGTVDPAFFVLGEHWVVQNEDGLLTTLTHGDDENLTQDIEANLLPVEFEDEEEYSGFDNITPDEGPWLMVPHDDENEIIAVTGASQSSPIEFEARPEGQAYIVPDPSSVSSPREKMKFVGGALGDGEYLVPGMGGQFADASVLQFAVYLEQQLDVTVHMIAKATPGESVKSPVNSFTESDLSEFINRIYKDQANVKINLTLKDEVAVDYDVSDHADFWADEGQINARNGIFDIRYNEGISLEEQAILQASPEVPNSINIYVVGSDYISPVAHRTYQGRYLGGSQGHLSGLARINEQRIWIDSGDFQVGTVDFNQSNEEVMQTIAHEIGHILIGAGHADQPDDVIVYPCIVPNTDPAIRLMVSGDGQEEGKVSRTLHKCEWDKVSEFFTP